MYPCDLSSHFTPIDTILVSYYLANDEWIIFLQCNYVMQFQKTPELACYLGEARTRGKSGFAVKGLISTYLLIHLKPHYESH